MCRLNTRTNISRELAEAISLGERLKNVSEIYLFS